MRLANRKQIEQAVGEFPILHHVLSIYKYPEVARYIEEYEQDGEEYVAVIVIRNEEEERDSHISLNDLSGCEEWSEIEGPWMLRCFIISDDGSGFYVLTPKDYKTGEY